MHFIQAKRAGARPWGWRDAVVESYEGDSVRVTYVHESGRPLLWSHSSLPAGVVLGQAVRVHEQCSVLDTGTRWYSVAVLGGAGPVPEPADPDLWTAEVVHPTTDISSGVAYPSLPRKDTDDN